MRSMRWTDVALEMKKKKKIAWFVDGNLVLDVSENSNLESYSRC